MTGQNPEKPVRQILEDIRQRTEFVNERRGVVNPYVVDRIVFLASIVSILLSSVVLLGMLWGPVEVMFGFKCIGSIMVVLFALLVFRTVNEHFSI
jgi:hypothetical protein